jgi:hypothetical protein
MPRSAASRALALSDSKTSLSGSRPQGPGSDPGSSGLGHVDSRPVRVGPGLPGPGPSCESGPESDPLRGFDDPRSAPLGLGLAPLAP